jgi:threonyl-tRNA synthetase
VTGGYGHADKRYEPLSTPHILRTDAWHTSGHIQNDRENMFLVYSLDELDQGLLGADPAAAGASKPEADITAAGAAAAGAVEPGRAEASTGQADPPAASKGGSGKGEGVGNYGLKPMNCPGHLMLCRVGTKSYRDLPLRYFEFGTVYGYERAGTLHGMLRVRSFTQDDAHIFCTPSQYESELEGVFDFCCHVLDTFGFDHHVGLKTRGDKRIGSDEIWDMAESGLRRVLEKRTAGKYCVEEGDATFYGPKVDFVIKDMRDEIDRKLARRRAP